LRTEIADLLLMRINLAIERRTKEFVSQFMDRDKRIAMTTWVKPTEEEPNPEPKAPKVKRATKNYLKMFQKSLKFLEKMEKFRKEWDSLIVDICTKSEEKNWVKEVNDETDNSKIGSTIKGMDKAFRTRQKLMQEFKKEILLINDFVANPEFTNCIQQLGVFALPPRPKKETKSKKKKKDEDEDEEKVPTQNPLPSKSFPQPIELNNSKYSNVKFLVDGQEIYAFNRF